MQSTNQFQRNLLYKNDFNLQAVYINANNIIMIMVFEHKKTSLHFQC
jgi:hypothetical protein